MDPPIVSGALTLPKGVTPKVAQRKKLTPLEVASQLREYTKNPMDPSLRKLVKKAVEMLITLSTPPPELEESPPELPSIAERINDSP